MTQLTTRRSPSTASGRRSHRASRHAAVVGVARTPEAHRHQIRLRRRQCGAHGAHRQQSDVLVPAPLATLAGAKRHHHRRPVGEVRPSIAESVARRAGSAVRLLPVGTDHACRRPVAKQTHPTRAEIVEHMSANICRCGIRAHRARDRTRGEGGLQPMTPSRTRLQIDNGRRRFMVGAAGFTFGVTLGIPASLLVGSASAAAASKDVVVNPWVTISTDGTIAIMSPAAKMGQGSLTALPLIPPKSSTPIGAKCASCLHPRATRSTATRSLAGSSIRRAVRR